MKKFLPIAVILGVVAAGFVYAAQSDQQTIAATIANDESGVFDVLSAAVEQAGLSQELDSNGSVTLLAPIDRAFWDAFGVDNDEEALAVIAKYDQAELRAILENHIVKGNRSGLSLMNAKQYSLANGGKLTKDQVLAAGLINKDYVDARNGTIHVLDRLIEPAEEVVE